VYIPNEYYSAIRIITCDLKVSGYNWRT
jgi:hypothetical protein